MTTTPGSQMNISRTASVMTGGVHDFATITTAGDATGYITLNSALAGMTPLLNKAEGEINKLMTELNISEAGDLDQSRLLYAQMASTRWQMAFQLSSNMLMCIGSGLKNTVQNVAR
jgi:hypothetical protein